MFEHTKHTHCYFLPSNFHFKVESGFPKDREYQKVLWEVVAVRLRIYDKTKLFIQNEISDSENKKECGEDLKDILFLVLFTLYTTVSAMESIIKICIYQTLEESNAEYRVSQRPAASQTST